MTTTPIDNTSITAEFNVDELTEGTLTGKGVFDVLLQTLRLHLDREFNCNRITGTAYATVYSQAITAFLGQAVEFTLAKSKLGLELERMREEVALVKLQQDKLLAETAQVKFNTDEILPLQKDKINADIVQTYKQTNLITQQLENLISEQLGIQANTTQTLQQTENLKVQEAQLKVEVEKSSYELDTTLPEQVELIRRNQRQVAIQTQLADYELTYVKPVEVVNLTKTGLGIDAQTAEITYRTSTVLPSQVAQTNAQKDLLAYDLTNIKPVELNNLTLAGLDVTAKTALTTQQTANLTTENSNLVKQGNLIDSQKVVQDKQALSIEAQTNEVTYGTNYVLPSQVAQTNAQKALLEYDLTSIKPVELNNLTLSGLDITAKTALTSQQTTNLVTENNNLVKQGNLIDSQKVVQDKQALSIEAGTAEVTYRTNYVLPSQVAQNDAQTASTVYSTANLLPKQVAQMQSQIDTNTQQTALYAQKVITEQAQATNAPAPTSVMGVQNALMEQQKNQIIRDAEQKTAKIMLDSWQTIFTTDQAIPPAGDISLLLTHVNAAKLKMLQGVGAV